MHGHAARAKIEANVMEKDAAIVASGFNLLYLVDHSLTAVTTACLFDHDFRIDNRQTAMRRQLSSSMQLIDGCARTDPRLTHNGEMM
jgi:hypothetical protein